MNPDLFDFELPEWLIAQHPLDSRSGARLLVLGDEGPRDLEMIQFPTLLRQGDLVIFNDTRVIPARCVGRKLPGGGRIEILLERALDDGSALVQIGTSKRVRDGQEFLVGGRKGVVTGRQSGFFRIRFEASNALAVFEEHGLVPLPPYIRREQQADDRSRYQTVFARHPGAVAAPTAGLHFDEQLLGAVDSVGARRMSLTLHVGAGTFTPVRVQRIEDHLMHAERYHISEDLANSISETRSGGGRVIAIGTTVVRALESAARSDGNVEPGGGDTRIFIYPGYRFRVVDALLTNFHLPRSTLLMLVSAFAGRERILDLYRHAVDKSYRFFSFGDAMFTERMT